MRWIRQHYAQPFKVEDVAQLAGMSVSAFYRNFQAVTAMSPIQFQKQIRLQSLRLLLAVFRPNDVTAVGHRVGYDSASQFSRIYAASSAHPEPGRRRLRHAAHHRGRSSLTRRDIKGIRLQGVPNQRQRVAVWVRR